MFGTLGWQELMIVLVIVMIIFGAGKLPEVMRSMGQGVKEFKNEANDDGGTIASSTDASSTTTTTTATVTGTDRDRRDETKLIETRELRAEEI